MAGITGQGTTFNLPNFVGELFGISPEDTPLLAAIGGLTGGRRATAKRFEWEFYDLRTPGDRTRVEGAAAPTAEERVRSNAYNVVEIHQETVEVSYTKLSTPNHLDAAVVSGEGSNPVANEMDWQLEQMLKQIALDVNWSFINGQFAEPANNATPRKTRGLLQAITTNVITATNSALPTIDFASDESATETIVFSGAHGLTASDRIVFAGLTGGAPLVNGTAYFVIPTSTTAIKVSSTRGGAAIDITSNLTAGTATKMTNITTDVVGDAMQMAFDNAGLQQGDTRTAIVNPLQKRRLTKAYVTDAGYKEATRNVGGVNLSTIETDFGSLNIMVDRQMPADTIAIVSLEDLAPVFLEVPGKGYFFVEPLAKTGASEASQIYGEIGLEYGNERKHAKIVGLG